MTDVNLESEIAELRLRLTEAEETIQAIRSGAVDAVVVDEPNGTRIYTLQAADRPYRLLVEEMQQGALTLSDDGTLAYCNRCFADLVGRPLERLMGVAFRDFIPPEAQYSYEGLLQQGRTGFSQGESHVRNAVGALVPVFLTLNALPADSGAAVGLIVTDLTSQHHHEKLSALLEALKEADRRKDEFLAMLGHELRNPLAPIASAVQLLGLQRGGESQIQLQARGIIERQLGRLQHLIDDLLEVSRITSGRVHLRLERVALSDIVHLATESVGPLMEQFRHQLKVSLPSEPIWLNADVARLEQVLVNLLANAAKYTAVGGRIDVIVSVEKQEGASGRGNGERHVTSAETEEAAGIGAPNTPNLATHHSPLATRYAVIRVRDTGVGISAALLPSIFELFTQAERSLDRSQGGLGIGLALVQRLTELHGGRVEASSVMGRGSEFVVRLPLMSDEWRAASTETGGTGHRATHLSPLATQLRVLVVDDNIDAAETLGMLLNAIGYQIRTVHDGPAAVKAALEFHPNLVLLDIGLPRMDGYAVARQMRQQPLLRNVVLVALTGYGQEADRQRSQEAGFDHHLVKPADFAKLQQILAMVSN